MGSKETLLCCSSVVGSLGGEAAKLNREIGMKVTMILDQLLFETTETSNHEDEIRDVFRSRRVNGEERNGARQNVS